MQINASTLLLLVFFSFVALDLAGRDFYKLLGVNRNASEKEIKKAFKKLAIKLHPDKNKGDENAQKEYQEVNDAYSVLSDPEKRRIYDQYGEEGLDKNKGGGGGAGGWGDIFGDFFGGGRRNNNRNGEMRKGNPLVIDLQCSLEDLYNGRDFEVLQRRQVLCHHCRGTGAEDPNDISQCPLCQGSGVRIKNQQLAPGFVQRVQTTCDRCGGKGKVVKSTCTACSGSKVEIGEQLVMIFVEKGMQSGHEIVLPSDSDENPDEEPGDLIFKIRQTSHHLFTRQGNDLYMTTQVSLLEALVGFSLTFKHLDGHEFTLERKEVTYPGLVQFVPGEGMPIHELPSQKGNLYVTYQIRFPGQVTESQKEAFRTLLKDM